MIWQEIVWDNKLVKTRFYIVVLVVSLVLLLLAIYVSVTLVNLKPKKAGQPVGASPVSTQISESEKQKIESWIIKEKLNAFGDSYDTLYTGGTPLFNETTGEKKDRYLYILEKHPNRPWK